MRDLIAERCGPQAGNSVGSMWFKSFDGRIFNLIELNSLMPSNNLVLYPVYLRGVWRGSVGSLPMNAFDCSRIDSEVAEPWYKDSSKEDTFSRYTLPPAASLRELIPQLLPEKGLESGLPCLGSELQREEGLLSLQLPSNGSVSAPSMLSDDDGADQDMPDIRVRMTLEAEGVSSIVGGVSAGLCFERTDGTANGLNQSESCPYVSIFDGGSVSRSELSAIQCGLSSLADIRLSLLSGISCQTCGSTAGPVGRLCPCLVTSDISFKRLSVVSGWKSNSILLGRISYVSEITTLSYQWSSYEHRSRANPACGFSSGSHLFGVVIVVKPRRLLNFLPCASRSQSMYLFFERKHDSLRFIEGLRALVVSA